MPFSTSSSSFTALRVPPKVVATLPSAFTVTFAPSSVSSFTSGCAESHASQRAASFPFLKVVSAGARTSSSKKSPVAVTTLRTSTTRFTSTGGSAAYVLVPTQAIDSPSFVQPRNAPSSNESGAPASVRATSVVSMEAGTLPEVR